MAKKSSVGIGGCLTNGELKLKENNGKRDLVFVFCDHIKHGFKVNDLIIYEKYLMLSDNSYGACIMSDRALAIMFHTKIRNIQYINRKLKTAGRITFARHYFSSGYSVRKIIPTKYDGNVMNKIKETLKPTKKSDDHVPKNGKNGSEVKKICNDNPKIGSGVPIICHGDPKISTACSKNGSELQKSGSPIYKEEQKNNQRKTKKKQQNNSLTCEGDEPTSNSRLDTRSCSESGDLSFFDSLSDADLIGCLVDMEMSTRQAINLLKEHGCTKIRAAIIQMQKAGEVFNQGGYLVSLLRKMEPQPMEEKPKITLGSTEEEIEDFIKQANMATDLSEVGYIQTVHDMRKIGFQDKQSKFMIKKYGITHISFALSYMEKRKNIKNPPAYLMKVLEKEANKEAFEALEKKQFDFLKQACGDPSQEQWESINAWVNENYYVLQQEINNPTIDHKASIFELSEILDVNLLAYKNIPLDSLLNGKTTTVGQLISLVEEHQNKTEIGVEANKNIVSKAVEKASEVTKKAKHIPRSMADDIAGSSVNLSGTELAQHAFKIQEEKAKIAAEKEAHADRQRQLAETILANKSLAKANIQVENEISSENVQSQDTNVQSQSENVQSRKAMVKD